MASPDRGVVSLCLAIRHPASADEPQTGGPDRAIAANPNPVIWR